MMKTISFLLTLLVIYGNASCKKTEYEGYTRRNEANNLTDEEILLFNLMTVQEFTAGTLLGLLVASMVVVIGSFLVLWRVCCEVEMVVTREIMEPLNSISQKVSKTSSCKTVSTETLLGHACCSTVLEIA